MHIILITDTKKIDPIAAASRLPINSWVILRDYDLSFEERYQLGIQLKKICIQKKLKLLVAKDSLLATKLNADGMHFPEFMIPKISFWRNKKPQWIITAATHCHKSCRDAIIYGADSVLISPIFKTISHPDKKPIGALIARKIAGKYHKKAHGLGGVTRTNAKTLQVLGFYGFSAVSGL